MPRLRMVVANKNYSSWSMRPWVLLRQAGIPFEEVPLWFSQDGHVEGIERWSPTGKVPVLWIDEEPVWDSLAICEAVAELYPDRALWPTDPVARRYARSMCAEMHSGVQELRRNMPMNLRNRLPGLGRTPGSERDIARVVSLWESCRSRFGIDGSLLFGHFTCADAMFAPVATRFRTYEVSLPSVAEDYCTSLLALPGVQAWCDAGRQETQFVSADEPYAAKPNAAHDG